MAAPVRFIMQQPTVSFDARTGLASGGVDPPSSPFSLSALRFTAPKEAEDRGDSKVCTARAYVLPGKGAMTISLLGASVAKVTHSRRDAHTVFVQVAGADDKRIAKRGNEALGQFLLALDARVLEIAQSNTDAWFMHKMNADLVEEYYRGCSGSVGGAQARFVLSSATESLPPDLLLASGSTPRTPVDLQLQLVGLKFRPQYFTCVWKLTHACISATPLPLPECEEDVVEFVVKKNKNKDKNIEVPMFQSDDDEGECEDDDDDLGPTAEERAEMRQSLMSRLLRLESDELVRVDALRAMIRRLDASSSRDELGVIGEIEEFVG